MALRQVLAVNVLAQHLIIHNYKRNVAKLAAAYIQTATAIRPASAPEILALHPSRLFVVS